MAFLPVILVTPELESSVPLHFSGASVGGNHLFQTLSASQMTMGWAGELVVSTKTVSPNSLFRHLTGSRKSLS